MGSRGVSQSPAERDRIVRWRSTNVCVTFSNRGLNGRSQNGFGVSMDGLKMALGFSMISVSRNIHTLCGTSHTETSTNIMELSGRIVVFGWVMGRSRTLVGRCVPYCRVSRKVGKSEKSVKSVKFGNRHRSQCGFIGRSAQ